MAADKLVDSTALDADLTTVANAIRRKGGTSARLSFPQGMAAAIAAIQGGLTPSASYTFLEKSTTRDAIYTLFSSLVANNTDPLAIWVRADSTDTTGKLTVVLESYGKIYTNQVFARRADATWNIWTYTNSATTADIGVVMNRYVLVEGQA